MAACAALFLPGAGALAQSGGGAVSGAEDAELEETRVSGAAASPARAAEQRREAVQLRAAPSVEARLPEPAPAEPPRPASVDTVSAAEIRGFQRRGLEDFLRTVPGTSVVQAGQAGGQASFFVRGMESNHTVVLLNGRRLPPGLAGIYQLEYLDISTLESVQLTRGAVSSLYGADALAGALDLRSTDARFVDADTLSAYAEAGSFSTLRTGQRLTLRDGPVGLALDAVRVGTDNDRPASAFENGVLRGNVAVDLGGGAQLDLLGYLQESRLEVAGSSLGFAFPEDQRNDNRTLLLSPRLTVEREDWSFSLFYSRSSNELKATRDTFFNDNLLEQTGDEIEALVHYRPAPGSTLSLGGGYTRQEFTRTPLIPGPFNNPAAFDYGYGSVFAQADLALPADFRLLVSGRHDEHDSFESKGTWSAGLSRRFEATGTTLHTKAATGYKVPSGQDFIFLAPGVDPSGISPEESFTWEAGASQPLLDGRARLAATYFRNEIDNLVDVDPFTFDQPAVVDTRSQGVEIEFRHAPCEGFEYYANYTWLDAFVVRGEYFGGFGGSPGDRLIRRPRHTLAAGVVFSGDRWRAGLEVAGAYGRPDSPGVILPDYTVARIFGSRRLSDSVEIYGRVENLFDASYEHTRGFEAAGIGAFAGARILLGR